MTSVRELKGFSFTNDFDIKEIQVVMTFLSDEYQSEERKRLNTFVKHKTYVRHGDTFQHRGGPVKVFWRCHQCHGPRGSEIVDSYLHRTYQSKDSLLTQFWSNPCGHLEDGLSLWREALENGLNVDLPEQPPLL
jgi:hypothetical protein